DAAIWQEAEGVAGGVEHGGSGAVVGGGGAGTGADAAGDGVWLRVADQRTAGVAGDGHRRESDGGDGASRQGSEGSAGAVVGAAAVGVAAVVVYASASML